LRGYEEITELIKRGDGVAAEIAWREHMDNARRYVSRTQNDDHVLDVLY
jgi:DNA-binding FadR family transcriptional regulator